MAHMAPVTPMAPTAPVASMPAVAPGVPSNPSLPQQPAAPFPTYNYPVGFGVQQQAPQPTPAAPRLAFTRTDISMEEWKAMQPQYHYQEYVTSASAKWCVCFTAVLVKWRSASNTISVMIPIALSRSSTTCPYDKLRLVFAHRINEIV